MVNTVSALALFAGAVAALHAPVGDPSGNPITAPLIEIVPACKPYTIKWTPTTYNKVSLVLLRGPSTNVVPLATIVEGIDNSGSFVWTPASSLEADTTHYGLQLIDDVTGQYQYSTQFGISKDACGAVSSVSSGYPTASVKSVSSSVHSSAYSTVVPSTSCNTTTVYTATSSHVAPTGYPVSNSSIVLPTKSMTVPVSLKTSASGSPVTPTSASASPTSPQSTGAASSLRAGLGLAGAIAGMVFML
ncbi:Ser-Thr-rich glycosyl-phosphatidyl-inositol-anchored membrane family-domain-containing protein [Clohesyomyces aquaticus]|uniref:Ser-Thr-rich glycosyl-phosphatidyl-inositol-anchored membrane family-domain-containing protein n=1 Tax=Clohesyomyces aquaticus TaxID=1231657 RepID=A0A1Y1Z7Z5_9PLEO|nr:Ser-Thr-rich glycosyl-phosphatidyl-inositol-anchored membrane family-domain-containing protein [Clohesyomyces aquaticus]